MDERTIIFHLGRNKYATVKSDMLCKKLMLKIYIVKPAFVITRYNNAPLGQIYRFSS